MPIYRCECCKYTTERLSNYNKHNNSKKHLSNKIEDNKINQTIINDYKNSTNITNNITNNTTNIINITNNFILDNFRDDDISDITDKDIIDCFKSDNMAHFLANFIGLINANPNRPKGMNILIKNKKDKSIFVYHNNIWRTVPKEYYFESFCQLHESNLGDWVKENGDNYKSIKKAFEQHIKRSSIDEKYVNDISDEIIFKIYDNRNNTLKIIKITNKDTLLVL